MHRLFSFVGACVVVTASACTSFDSGTGDPDAGTSVVEPTRDGGSGSCGPQNCGGCCLGDACQSGTSVSGCGAKGGLCAICRAGQICRPESQTCGVDLESTWVVQPVSAEIQPTNPGGSAWDVGPAGVAPPDVFVTMACPGGNGVTTKTPIVPDSLAPKWTTGGCTRKAKELLGGAIQVGVKDDDRTVGVGSDEIVMPDSPLQLVEADLLSGARAMPALAGVKELKLTLTRQ
jgi:hypothetical protein